MEETSEEIKILTPGLRDLLQRLQEEIDSKLQHSRRILLVDVITHINGLSRDTYYQNRELYSKLMVILNVGMKAGKVYFDEL